MGTKGSELVDTGTVIAITSEDLSAVKALRQEVLGWSETDLDRDTVTNVRHFVARTAGGDVVACGSCALVAFPDDDTVRFGAVRAVEFWGVAVHPEHQNRGLGTAIMNAVRSRAVEQNADLVWAEARLSAVPFYEHLRYEPVGEVFHSELSDLPSQRVVLNFFTLSLRDSQ